mmetsp:Transcript_33726/g.68053  ORF Transcript_33726/g.68053 Transcript_33726/m.68053 type:complete len:87 (-) Transcript_33726:688-948(-)
MKNYPSSTCVLGSKRRLHQAPSHLARSTFIATLALTVASVALAKEAVDGPMRVIMEEELARLVNFQVGYRVEMSEGVWDGLSPHMF